MASKTAAPVLESDVFAYAAWLRENGRRVSDTELLCKAREGVEFANGYYHRPLGTFGRELQIDPRNYTALAREIDDGFATGDSPTLNDIRRWARDYAPTQKISALQQALTIPSNCSRPK